MDGDELRQFLFQQLVLGREPVNFAECFCKNLPERDAAVSLDCLAQFVEIEEVFRFVEQRGDDDLLRAFDVALLVARPDLRHGLDLIFEAFKELAVNLHAINGDDILYLRPERVGINICVAVRSRWGRWRWGWSRRT
ncbi:MAG: hypothetical protein BWX80_02322 [Candidatus Hydrogenedentes bacterium ADurb.Bin101]|nr:MAG: hypothetical protein BWX80_02322 [Candidatus Hydrogenedentes bacterium ADurb.Bin101]